VWVKAKSFGPDSMVFSMSSKFIGNITTNLLVPAPALLRLPMVNHETLSNSCDVFEYSTASTTDTFWLPLAWQRTKPLYILTVTSQGGSGTVVCQASDSLSGITGNHAHPAARAHYLGFLSNAAHGWYVCP
jgi:hypothetical protein